MPDRHPVTRYSDLSIALHWLMLGLIALTYAFTELRVLFERGTPERDFMRQAHFSCGLTVLGLALVRLVARWFGGTPAIHPPLPAWQRRAARLSHALLYAFMIGMPLLALAMMGLRGDEVIFFGIELPPLLAEDKDLGKQLRGWHGDIGRAVYALIALHAAAAIYHHRIRGDDTLRHMLPGRP
ncbi:cytochrome b [uncultured Methylibium sp.]|uniref:cytochrome b n=1 Tax=uncultured Methylibium sp. TaxID=381093 RepID=UPI0025D50EF0|nr:cytochrome b [uncultured Methylibium sp.]